MAGGRDGGVGEGRNLLVEFEGFPGPRPGPGVETLVSRGRLATSPRRQYVRNGNPRGADPRRTWSRHQRRSPLSFCRRSGGSSTFDFAPRVDPLSCTWRACSGTRSWPVFRKGVSSSLSRCAAAAIGTCWTKTPSRVQGAGCSWTRCVSSWSCCWLSLGTLAGASEYCSWT